MKIVTVVGVRPQFIKAAVVSACLAGRRGVEERLVHTGQHYDFNMSDVFFDQLELPAPHHHLGVGSGSHSEQTAAMLVGVERVLLEEKPNLVLVYGDTNSTLAGALAAAKLGIPVAHVEAGLRSFDRTMPEEVNRLATDRLSQWFFAPTATAVANLRREGLTEDVHLVGDVTCDALRRHRDRAMVPAELRELSEAAGGYAVCTVHRCQNTDDEDRFRMLWNAIDRLSSLLPVVWPVHPRTRKVLGRLGLEGGPRLHLIGPLGYLEMLALQERARLVVTDSGGVQREAYLLGVPCITLRDRTEWVETVQTGWNVLVGTNEARLLEEAGRFLDGWRPSEHPALFGQGDASQRIVEVLMGRIW